MRFAALVACLIGLAGLCGPAHGAPSTECTPSTRSISVVRGGSTTYTALSICSVFGLSGVAVQPSHGTLTDPPPGGNGTGNVTYTHNNDSATSDTFGVYDDIGDTVTFNVTITTAAPIAGAVSATVTRNTSNNPITLNLSGGAATSVTVASGASHGTASASGTTIRYTPTGGYSGSDSFTYTATNTGGTSAPATVSITVAAPTIVISPPSLSAGSAGTAYSQTLTASGGTGPYSFSATGVLPSGVTLGAAGTLIGTPAAPGTYNFTVTATDSNNNTGARAYSWTINVAAPIAGAVSATVAANTSNNPITLNLSGGTAASVAVATGAAQGTATASGTSITYTPAAGYSGSDSFTYTATNTSGTSSPATVSITVTAPTIAISPTSLSSGTVGTPYSQTLTASGGTAPYTFLVTGGALPGGVTLGAGGNLSGTPTAAGSYSFTVSATDSFSYVGPRSYTWIVNPAAPVAGTVSATVGSNTSNNPITLNLSGGAAASVAVAGAASHGTAVASGTSITYTPAGGYSGADSFTYTATNVSGTSSPATVSITVAPPTITVSPTSFPIGTAGTSYSQTLTSSGGLAPYSYAVSAGTLPSGVTLSNNGTLSGTPAASGSYAFTVVSTDDNLFTGSRSYSWTVNPAAPVASAVSATITANTSNNAIALSLSGGAASSVAVATGASHGTATASGTGITYTPTAGYSGPDSFTYTATNVSGTSAPATVSITVAVPTIAISPVSVPVGTAGTAYSQAITAGGGAAPYTYAVSAGSLPGGVTLSASGALSGTPASAGSFNFTVQASDTNTNVGTRAYAWTVNPAAPVANAVSVTVTSNTSNNAITPNLSGGTATSVAVATAASHGTALASGTSITYVPTVGYSGPDTFTYTASNVSGTSAPATVTVTVATPTIALGPTTIPVGVAGTAYSQAITASGGTSPYTYAISAGALPTGVTLGSGGSLSGTPLAGSYTFTVTATDGNTNIGVRAYAWTVNPAVPVAGAVSATVSSNTSANPITPTLGGGPATSLAISGAPAHGTAVASGTTLSYTPTAGYSGPDSFAYTATNVSGTSAAATVTVTVSSVTVTLNPSTLAVGTAGSAYSGSVTASGGTPGYTYAIGSGALPAGVALSPSGALSGAPAAAGTYGFTVVATDSRSNAGSRAYAWIVNPAAPTAGNVAATVASNTSGNAIALSLGGGTTTSVAVASAAAHGSAVASGTTISYTPTAGYSGPDSFGYTATNVGGTSTPATVSITVSAVTLTLPSTLGTGTVGTAFTQALAPGGGTPPYSYSVSGGALPPGIGLTPGGILSGTPTAAGAYGFTVLVVDGGTNTGSRTYAWTVNPAIPIAGAVATTVPSNSTGNAVALALGGGLAAGVAVAGQASHGSAVASGTGIAYTPAIGYSGSDSFTYTATNVSGTSAPATVVVTVDAVTVTVTPSSLSAAIAGTAASQVLTASGGTPPYTYAIAAGALPAGVALGSDGTLSGTPVAAGTYGFTIGATDSHANAGSRAYAWVVNPALPIAGAVAANVFANSGGNPLALALGGGVATSVAVATAPTHGIATANGTAISYAPAAGYSGSDSFTYTASNATGTSVAATATITVTAVTLTLSPSTLAVTKVGTAFSQAFSTAGSASAITYRVGSGALPAGLTLTPAGVLAGTATTSGSYAFTVVATDASTNTGSQAYSLLVNLVAPAPPAVVQTVASNASRTPMRLQLAGTGALSVVVATLPEHGTAVAQGLDLLYTPAPNYTGPDSFTYSVTTPAGTSDPAPVAVTVSPLAMAIAPATLSTVPEGRSVGVALQASGGVAPYAFRMAYGALPPGLALAGSGMLSGSPTTEGLYAFTVVATDAGGVVQSRDYTMSVGRVARADPSTQSSVIGVVFAQIASTERFTDALLDNVGRHLDQVGRPSDLCGDLVAVGTSAAAPAPVAAPRMFAPEARPLGQEPASGEQLSCALPIPVWVGGSLQHGHASPAGNAGNGFSTSGVTVGVDLPGTSWLGWGAALDYGRDRTDSGGLASANRARSLLLSLYGRVTPLPWLFVDGVAGGGRLSFSSRRPTDVAGSDVAGDRDGTSWFASMRVGNDLRYETARLITYLRADFKAARLDAYSERGSPDFALTYQAMRWTSHAVTAGARGSLDIPLAIGILSPGVDASFRHTGANEQVQRLFYTDLGPSSQTYDLATRAVPQSTTTVTAGLKLSSRSGPVYAVEVGRSSGGTGLRQVGARASVRYGF